MNIDWCDEVPDQNGTWLIKYKITDPNWQGDEWTVGLVKINVDDGYYYSECMSPRYGRMNHLTQGTVRVNHNGPSEYELLYSSSEIEI